MGPTCDRFGPRQPPSGSVRLGFGIDACGRRGEGLTMFPKDRRFGWGVFASAACMMVLFLGPGVSDGPKTDETCRFENRVLAGGSKTPSEGCSDGGVRLDWFSVQGGLIWSLVR